MADNSIEMRLDRLKFHAKAVLFTERLHEDGCDTRKGVHRHCDCGLSSLAYESGWNMERENSEAEEKPDFLRETAPYFKLETQQANEAGDIVEEERGLFASHRDCCHGHNEECMRPAELGTSPTEKSILAGTFKPIRGPLPGETPTEIMLRGAGAEKHPVDGWVNVYLNAYGIIWGSEDSADNAKHSEADLPHAGAQGEYLRTVRIAEVRPGMGLYSQEQVDVMLKNEHAAVNRSAGRSLMDMLNGVRDVSRKGGGSAEQVMDSQERAITKLQALANINEAQYLAEKAKNAELQAQIATFNKRLEDLVEAMVASDADD